MAQAGARRRANKTLYSLAAAGLMAALVYAGNLISIPFIFDSRVHLGNSMCLLAGLLFGGVSGGFSSGIGGVMYDMFNPLYAASAPFTFVNKFAMGFAAGHIRRRFKSRKAGVMAGAIIGQLIYIVLYLGKTFIEKLLLGEPVSVIWSIIGVKAATSGITAVASVAISVPLYFAIEKALRHTAMGEIIGGGREKSDI